MKGAEGKGECVRCRFRVFGVVCVVVCWLVGSRMLVLACVGCAMIGPEERGEVCACAGLRGRCASVGAGATGTTDSRVLSTTYVQLYLGL